MNKILTQQLCNVSGLAEPCPAGSQHALHPAKQAALDTTLAPPPDLRRAVRFLRWRGCKGAILLFSMLLAPAHVALADLHEGLILHASFDEAGGTLVLDHSLEGNNGTLIESLPDTRVAGYIGSALAFNGSTPTHVLIPDGPSFRGLSNITFSAWVNAAADWSHLDRPILAKEGPTGHSFHFGCDRTPDGYKWGVLFAHQGETWSGGDATRHTCSLPVDRWVHLTATYDGTTTRFYQDGLFVASTGAFSGPIGDSAATLRIGLNSDFYGTGNEARFRGIIDEVRIYNRALSDTEVGEVFGLPAPIDLTAGLIAHWPLDGDTQDASGHGNHGTFVGAPEYRTGMVGPAVRLNTTYIDIPNVLEGVNSFSMALWALVEDWRSGGNADPRAGEALISVGEAATGWAGIGAFGSYEPGEGNDVLVGGSPGAIQHRFLKSEWFNRWHHLCVTHDAQAQKSRFYIDGVLTDDVPASLTLGASTAALGRHWFDKGASSSWRMVGMLDDVRVYNRALCDADVKGLYSLASTCDDFEDGIGNAAWVYGGARRQGLDYDAGTWQWKHQEANGALQIRLFGPASDGANQGEAWVRTRFDYNNGLDHLINFTWGAQVNACHVDAFAIQITDGQVLTSAVYDWFYHDTAGTKNLYLIHSELPGQPECAPGVRIGQTSQPPTSWSIFIDGAAGTATLYSGPTMTGTVIGQKVLDQSQPWYVRFIQGDGTSAGRPAGDNSLFLYDYCAQPSSPSPLAPTIVSQPASQAVMLGSRVSFSVQAKAYPWPAYQWQFNGSAIPGANSSTYTIPVAEWKDAGSYSVVVSNALGNMPSAEATLTAVDLNMIPRFVLRGPIGAKYDIQYSRVMPGTTSDWTTLTNIMLAAESFEFIDWEAARHGQPIGFYRAVKQ